MNARQKAKKYKRELNKLQRMIMPTPVIQHRRDVKTFVSTIVVENDLQVSDAMIEKNLIKNLTQSETFKEAFIFSKVVHPDTTKYIARLDVVM